MKRFITLLLCVTAFAFNSQSQLLTWTPDFAKDNDNLVITMDATKGNQGLLNYSTTSDVYVHIGVITNLSANQSDWKYVPFTWATTPAAAHATYLGNNKWQYSITNIRAFFNAPTGVPSAETIKKVVILFRNGAGTSAQRNADGTDMYIPIYDNTTAVRFSVPLFQPLYVPLPETITKQVGDNISLTAIANKPSTMKLYLNGTVIQTATNVTTLSANPALAIAGTQNVMAEANDGTNTVTSSFQFFVANNSTVLALPAGVRDGINYEAGNTSAVLVLYAPGKNRVSVIGEFPGSNWTEQSNYVMNKTPDGNYWWLRITGLTPGTEYAFQYLVDGSLKVAEPYSEKILDPSFDGSISAATYPNLKSYPTGLTSGIVSVLQTGAPAYTWAINSFTRPDKRNLIVYELLLRDFLATHDWKTLRDTLSYLKNLGINAIEIMPFNEFEGNDSWGYNPDFYFAPDKFYGPKNTLKEFVDSCHKRGIAVVMDIALNHATGSCPLAALYWNSATGQPAANNPWFNVVATHPFNVFNDFNHESLATRYFTSRVVEFWLQEYKLDGFRFDLSKGFTQNTNCAGSLSDVTCWGHYDASRIAIWKRYYDTLQATSPGCYAILEHFADNDEETALSNYGMLLWGNDNYNFTQASMGYTTDWNFESGLSVVRGWINPYLVTYMESHDEERMMYKNLQFGNASGTYNTKDLNTGLKRSEMCTAFFLNMPGPKMIWEFGELGYDFSINRCAADGSVNNNCRTDDKPIHWDYLQNAQRKQLHDVYSNLLKLRFHPLFKDDFTSNRVTRNLAGAFKWLQLTTDTSNICVIGNFDVTSTTGSVSFQNAGTWYDYLNGTTFTATGSAQNITLQAGEYHVYINRNLAGGTVIPPIDTAATLFIKVYPVPVRSNSTIELHVPEDGKVQVDLWNTLGQKVATIYSGTLPKGVTYLPLSNLAGLLPGGIYLVKAQENSRSAIRKLAF